ncbi:hypothetical protein RSOLAG1IB_10717 [Rhizoctonia solani AG-1 IB]|uniref:Uncharacterized protein n=1 Tax=Thanatephorus cucumeris (strain AG1-IB / isolate 7/3/14) TaxID=1108050 RepID=A0A0B7FZJ1_THACB|nr:hypothetical protein RSOLAG1IB_10717 [Rhizoctonia solani AG-1 IB]
MTSQICSRICTPERTSGYRDQLFAWCARVRINYITFDTRETIYCDEDGHKLYQAIPIFPKILVLPGNRAQYDDRHKIDVAPSEFGWGLTVRRAEEDAAQRLMISGRYCYI